MSSPAWTTGTAFPMIFDILFSMRFFLVDLSGFLVYGNEHEQNICMCNPIPANSGGIQ
jgi:hypothetical protein